jgi:DNA-binding NtrC family response regulator
MGTTPAPDASRLLVVEDEPSQHNLFRELFDDRYSLDFVLDAETAEERTRANPFDCILLDLMLPGVDGLTFLRRLRDRDLATPVIVITAKDTARDTRQAFKLNVEDYFTKPWEPKAVFDAVNRAVEKSRGRHYLGIDPESGDDPLRFEAIAASSSSMCRVVEMARRLCFNGAHVLITGETGTGKELLARAIHDNGARRDGPFIAVNCAAMPPTLAESLVFGHEKGAFTGADQSRAGWFELAHGGTLFLDEISRLSVEIQDKLLRVIQDGRVRRVGSDTIRRPDVRIVAASNMSLRDEIAAGRFRKDLFYRLNVFSLHIPPLKERMEDVRSLLEHFREIFSHYYHKQIKGYSEDTWRLLVEYTWPGNVREMRNLVERLVFWEESAIIGAAHLPVEVRSCSATRDPRSVHGYALRPTVDKCEREIILNALVDSSWNQTRAAEMLNINRRTLIEKMKKHSLRMPQRTT